MHAEAFEIVVRIIQGSDLQFAAVAGPRVDLSYMQRTAKNFAGVLVDLSR